MSFGTVSGSHSSFTGPISNGLKIKNPDSPAAKQVEDGIF
jgi:hypothetical protein